MITEKNKKISIWHRVVTSLFAFLAVGSFLFASNVLAANDYTQATGLTPIAGGVINSVSNYDKSTNGTLSAIEWNGLAYDFVKTWATSTMVGPLGIGTSNPLAPFSIHVGTNENFGIRNNAGKTDIYSVNDTNDTFQDLWLNGGVVSILGSNGYMGIGTTNPTTRLYVNDVTGFLNTGVTKLNLLGGSGSVLVMADNNGTLYATSTASFISGSGFDLWKGTKNGNIWNGDAGVGNVGIGTNAPGAKLHVNNSVGAGLIDVLMLSGGTAANGVGPNMVFNSGYSSYPSWRMAEIGSTFDASTNYSGNLIFKTNGSGNQASTTEKMRITKDGLIGIGTTNPGRALDVQRSADYQLRLGDASTSYYDIGRNSVTGYLNFYGNQSGYNGYNFSGTDRTFMTILNTGNVGIGTTAPTALLDLNQNTAASSTLHIKQYGGATGVIIDTVNPGGANVFQINNTSGQTWNTSININQISNAVNASFLISGLNITGNFGHYGSAGEGVGINSSITSSNVNTAGDPTLRAGRFGAISNAAGTTAIGLHVSGSSTSGKAYGLYSSSGLNYFAGNVGIGTNNPGTTLDVVGTFRNSLSTTHSLLGNAGNAVVMSDNNGTLYNTSLATFVSANSLWSGTKNGNIYNGDAGAGNVGIGTTSPATALHISSTGSTQLTLDSPVVASAQRVGINFRNSSGARDLASIYAITGSSYLNSSLVFNVNNGAGSLSERMRFDANGVSISNSNVGIGTTAPSAILHVNDTSYNRYATRVQASTYNTAGRWTGIGFSGENANTKGAILFQSNGSSYSRGNLIFALNNIADQSNATTSDAIMTLMPSGNVGIGTAIPGTTLDVAGTFRNSLTTTHSLLGGAGSVVVMADNSGTLFSTSTTSFISSNSLDLWKGTKNGNIYNGDAGAGNVGIGTTAPNAKLTIGTAMTGTTLGSTFITNAGSLGGNTGDTLTLANIGFTSGNVSSLGLRAYRVATGAGWTTSALTLGMDVDNTNNAGGYLSFLNGNVGIGVINPGAPLDVLGGIRTTLNTYLPTQNVAGIVPLGSSGITGAQNWTIRGVYQYSSGVGGNAAGGDLDLIKSQDGNTILATKTDGTPLGNVGIGTTGPGTTLDVVGTFRNSLTTTHSLLGNAGNAVVMSDNNGTLYNTSLATFVSANSLWSGTKNGNIYNGDAGAGNVGIGTTGPVSKLDVAGTIHSSSFANPSSGLGLELGWDGNYGIIQASDHNGGVAQRPLALNYGGGNVLLIPTGTGSVGIGTTTPDVKFNVYNSSAIETAKFETGGTFSYIRTKSTSGDNIFGVESAGGWVGPSTNIPLNFKTNDAIRMTILNTNGNVGIGTTGPTTRLYVNDVTGFLNTGVTKLSLLGASGNVVVMADNTGTLYSTSTASFISSNSLDLWHGTKNGNIYNGDAGAGNVGIGTTNPDSLLTVINNSATTNSIVTGENIGALTTGTAANGFGVAQLFTLEDASGAGIWTNEISSSWVDASAANRYARLDFWSSKNNTRSIAMSIDQNGNTGIGTTNPLGKLSVADGDIEITGVDAASRQIRFMEAGVQKSAITNIGSDDSVRFWTAVGGDILTLKGGSVGIGTTIPGTTLDVVGTFRNSLTTTHSLLGNAGNAVVMSDNNGTLYNTSLATFVSANSLWSGTKDGDIWNGTSGVGNVGIGTNNPGAKLDIAGSGAAGLLKIGGANFTTVSNGGDLILRGLTQLRFQDGNDWDWNKWAGIKYDSTNARLTIGGPASSAFQANANPPQISIILDGGNVGIGTTNPDGLLTISKDSDTPSGNDGLRLSPSSANPQSGWGFRVTSSNYDLSIDREWGGWALPPAMLLQRSTGNVGIGTTNPTHKLDVQGGFMSIGDSLSASANNQAFVEGSATIAYFGALGTQRASFGNSENWETLTADGGNVGIGTTGPGTTLDVVGTFRNSQSTTHSLLGNAGNAVVMTDNNGTLYNTSLSTFVSANSLWSGTKNGNIYNGDAGAGNVGIGTTVPLEKLYVEGAVNDTGIEWAAALKNGNNTGNGNPYGVGLKLRNGADSEPGKWSGIASVAESTWSNTTGLALYANASEKVRITNNGNVGIGTTAPGAGTKLNVAGRGLFTGGAVDPGDSTASGVSISYDGTQGVIAGIQTSVAYRDLSILGKDLIFGANSVSATERMRIVGSTGNVGIGTTAPIAKLNSVGNTTSTGYNGSYTGGGHGHIPWGGVYATYSSIPGAGMGDARGDVACSGGICYGGTAGGVFTGGDGSYVTGAGAGLSAFGGNGGYYAEGGTGIYAKGGLNGGWYAGNYGVAVAPAGYFDGNMFVVGGNVGIGTTNTGATLDIPSGSIRSLTALIAGLGNAGDVMVMADNSGNLFSTSTASLFGTMTTDLNMNGFSIKAVNKLTVTTIDPLYTINGSNYSTYAASIAGGVKEEYIGHLKIDQPSMVNGQKVYEKVLDFDKIKEGDDLWVWRKVVDFNKDNIEVLITPYGGFANSYYTVNQNKIIFYSSNSVEISYRLIGRRIDWRDWPTKQLNTTEKGIIIN